MKLVELVNVSKIYAKAELEVPALRSITLDIEEGEYSCIMGPSGSGKSTLLNLLGCLDKPSAGEYRLGGENIRTMNDSQLSMIRGKRIGFIFQSYNLINQLNVIENIQLPMLYQGWNNTDSKKRSTELAAQVGLADRLKHKPAELSGGQQQRVAIARALANDPLFILADEPTGNLDSKSGEEILLILDELNKNGKTILMVTHDESIAKRARRVIRLLDGEIEKDERKN